MAFVKFHRGLDATYTASKYKDGIYFATDTGCIYLNGIQYGGNSSNLLVKDVDIKDSILTVIYTDGTSNKFEFEELIAEASDTSAGLMSPKAKVTIDKVSEALDAGQTFVTVEQTQILNDVKAGIYVNKIEEVSVDDKVLSITNKKLSSNISLSYDELTKRIVLTGKNGVELGSIDATRFVKDGMLTSVSMEVNPTSQPEGTYLVFVWNTDSGKSEPMYIPLTSLIDVYKPGKGIDINGNVVSLKVNHPYLEVTDEGLSFTGENEILAKIAIKTVDETPDSGISVTNSNGSVKISVNKEELANSLTEEYVAGNTIKLGSSIKRNEQEIIPAETKLTAAIQILSDEIKSAVAGGITTIEGDQYISATKQGTVVKLVVDPVKIGTTLIDNTSALKVDENSGNMFVAWDEI